MTEERLRELFREMRDEPVPADSLARVGAGISARITRRRWLWAGAFGLVPACALVLLLMLRLPAPAPLPAVAPIVSAPLVQPAVIRSAPRRVHRRKQTVASVPASIRIETDDPDVVIVLVGN